MVDLKMQCYYKSYMSELFFCASEVLQVNYFLCEWSVCFPPFCWPIARSMLDFVQDGGQYLVAVDEANEHVISLWDWQKGDKGHKITETKVSQDHTHTVWVTAV